MATKVAKKSTAKPAKRPARKSAKSKTPPWDRENPRGDRHQSLTVPEKTAAKRRAQRAGRPYPNLVDNMQAAAKHRGAKKKTTTPAKSSSAAKRPRKTATRKRATKDPEGGLTAAGRAEFGRKEGAHLRPGVRKRDNEMTPEEMRRKGSWAARFYGRKTLPPLRKANGEPTRFALSAHAWGEPVPSTEAAARKIAAKGRQLLQRYRDLKARSPAKR